MALPQSRPFPRIVRDPRIHGGEPVIRGTRIPVRAIVVAWQDAHQVPDLLQAYPRLSEADIHEALAYYQAYRQEIDERIRTQFADD